MEIYLVTDSANGKMYVGQTVGTSKQRWSSHKSKVATGSQLFFHRAIRKHGTDSFKVETLCECPDKASMDSAEKFFIWFLGTSKHSFGYNLAKGGARQGVKVSQQTKEKISMAQKGKPKPGNSRPMDDKTKTKLSIALKEYYKSRPNPFKGKKHSPETKMKISASKKGCAGTFNGRKHTPESIEKMILAHRREK